MPDPDQATAGTSFLATPGAEAVIDIPEFDGTLTKRHISNPLS